MVNVKRKTISLLLAVILMVAFIPSSFVFAADSNSDGPQVSEAAFADGQIILMEADEGEPLVDISNYEFKLSKEKFFYNGQPLKPDVICEGLPEDAYYVEYEIDEGDWYDEGKYSVYVTGNADKGYTGTVTLSYKIALTTIDLNKYSATMYRKGTLQLKATVNEPDGKTIWKSSNTKVATVSSSGKVTAKAKGTAKIRAINGNAWEEAKITVKNPYLNKKSITLVKGKSAKLKITGKVGKATFKSNNKKIATVSSSGKIKAKKKGKCTITVKSNGITMKCKVKVKKP